GASSMHAPRASPSETDLDSGPPDPLLLLTGARGIRCVFKRLPAKPCPLLPGPLSFSIYFDLSALYYHLCTKGRAWKFVGITDSCGVSSSYSKNKKPPA